jgi:hypothetical protein
MIKELNKFALEAQKYKAQLYAICPDDAEEMLLAVNKINRASTKEIRPYLLQTLATGTVHYEEFLAIYYSMPAAMLKSFKYISDVWGMNSIDFIRELARNS